MVSHLKSEESSSVTCSQIGFNSWNSWIGAGDCFFGWWCPPGTQEVNPHQLKWKLRLKSLVHGWACSQFVCQILNLQLLWQFTFFWWIGSLFPIRLVWLISQSNLNGFCFNMAHFEALLEVALWLELTRVDSSQTHFWLEYKILTRVEHFASPTWGWLYGFCDSAV